MNYQIVSDNFSFVNYVEMKLLGSVYESVTDDTNKMDPIEQLCFSKVGLKWANYRQLQQITADYR